VQPGALTVVGLTKPQRFAGSLKELGFCFKEEMVDKIHEIISPEGRVDFPILIGFENVKDDLLLNLAIVVVAAELEVLGQA
jgi:hypothetical protein